MKNILKSSAVAVLMLVSLTSMAEEPTTSLTRGSEATSLVFKMNAPSQASSVSISDENGHTLFYEYVMDADYSKLFNLKNLHSGTYHLNVNDEASTIVYAVAIKDKMVTSINKIESITPSVFEKEGQKVHLNLENKDLSKVNIKILNEADAQFYGETLISQNNIVKTFNFEKANKGNYTITVKNGKKVYQKNINVN